MSPDQVEKVQHGSVEDFWLIEVGSDMTSMSDLVHPTDVQIMKVLLRVKLGSYFVVIVL